MGMCIGDPANTGCCSNVVLKTEGGSTCDPANTGCCSNVVLKTEGGSTSRVYQDGIVFNDARTTTIHLQCKTQVLTLMRSTHTCSVT